MKADEFKLEVCIAEGIKLSFSFYATVCLTYVLFTAFTALRLCECLFFLKREVEKLQNQGKAKDRDNCDIFGKRKISRQALKS